VPDDAFVLNRRTVERLARMLKRSERDEQRRPARHGASVSNPAHAFLIGKTDEAIAQFASGTVSVYGLDPGASVPPADETYLDDTTNNIEAFSLFGDVATGNWVLCQWVTGFWLIVQAECA